MRSPWIANSLLGGILLVWGTASVARGQGAAAVVDPLQTHTWRYVTTTVEGHDIIKRQMMTWDEGLAWDQQEMEKIRQDISSGQSQVAPPGADLNAVATWKLYHDQLKLWDEYVKQTALSNIESNASVSSIAWVPGGEGQQQPGSPMGTGPEAVVAANQSRSLNQQTASFFSAGGPQGPQGPQQTGPISRDGVLQEVLSVYEIFKSEGKMADELTYKNNQNINKGLTEREGQRLAYRNWLDDRKDMVIETAQEWGREQQGQVVAVGGVQYELYSPAQGLPKGPGPANVVRVVTDHLTPYDVLNPDGSQKQPSRQ